MSAPAGHPPIKRSKYQQSFEPPADFDASKSYNSQNLPAQPPAVQNFDPVPPPKNWLALP